MKRFKKMVLFYLLSALILTGAGATEVFAGPADPRPVNVTQPDGSSLRIRDGGDEYFRFTMTEEGYLVIKDNDGFYRFVVSDGKEGLKKGAAAFEGKTAGALKISDLNSDALKDSYARLRGYSYGGRHEEDRGEPVTLSRLRSSRAGVANIAGVSEDTALMPMVTIVVSFNNVPSREDYNWHGIIYQSEHNLTDYYKAMSNGKFTFAPAEESCEITTGVNADEDRFDRKDDGVIHVTVDLDHEDWTVLNPSENDVKGKIRCNHLKKALIAAVEKADRYIDFSKYDLNKNKKIEDNELALTFILAGFEGSVNAEVIKANDPSWESCVWAHQGYLTYWYEDTRDPLYPDKDDSPAEADGVELDKYLVIAEKMPRVDDKGKAAEPLPGQVGVYFHELGHYLGLPDLYDTAYRSEGPWLGYSSDNLSLMDGGGWAVDEKGNSCPTALDAWSRAFLRWVDPVDVDENGKYTVNSQDSENGYNCLRVFTENEGEYYLIENRRAEGTDAGLFSYRDEDKHDYSDNGIVLWHIDDGIYSQYPGEVNGINHRPAVMPLFFEEKRDGSGWSLDFNNTKPDKSLPFYSKTSFETFFGEGIAEGLMLPTYGVSNGAENPEDDPANDPDNRLLSDTHLWFDDDPGREMSIEIRLPERVYNRPLATLFTEEELKILKDPAVSSLSKNSILLIADRTIDKRVSGYSVVTFGSPVSGEGKEYWTKIMLNSGLRYDGRKHVLKGEKAGKSKNADLNVQVFYCEKAGEFAGAAPSDDRNGSNGTDGWTEATVSKVKLANMKGATVDFLGQKAGNVKGYSKSTYLSGITLKDKELNKTLGKALNKRLKELSSKLKSDKTSDYTDADLDREDAAEELKLLIPVYPLYIGDVYSYTDNSYKIMDGNGALNDYGVELGSYDYTKKKLVKAAVNMKYEDGSAKKLKLKYNAKKPKDFRTEVSEIKNSEGRDVSQLEAAGNFFGFVDYQHE